MTVVHDRAKVDLEPSNFPTSETGVAGGGGGVANLVKDLNESQASGKRQLNICDFSSRAAGGFRTVFE